MRIFVLLFTFTVIHLRWAHDYEYDRDVRLFYTFGKKFGSLAEFQRQRSLIQTIRENPWIKTVPSEAIFDFRDLNFEDYMKEECNCDCGKANIEKRKWAEGGEEVKPPYKYPWMVAFKRKGHNGIFCGGALITDTYILTAAHCLDRYPESDHKGEKSRLTPWKTNEIQLYFVTKTRRLKAAPPVQRLIPHHGFNFKTVDHDIGLVKLIKAVPYTKYTRPICLPPQGIPVNIGKIFQIAGWGVEKVASTEGSKYLLEAKIQHVPFSKCEHKFQKHLKRNYYCLKGLEGQSPCHGDSGGPMFLEHDGTYYVLGVTSMHSSNECDPDDTFVYTSVSSHISWIKSVLGAAFPTGQKSSSSNWASSFEKWASSSTGQGGPSSFWASPIGQWEIKHNKVHSNGQRPSSSNWGYSADQHPSSSKWVSPTGQWGSFYHWAQPFGPFGQQPSSSKWEKSSGHWPSSSMWEKSSGHWPSSSMWEKSSGHWPSPSKWEKSSGHWPSSSVWEHSNGKGESSSNSADSNGQGASSSNSADSNGQGASSSMWEKSFGQQPSSSKWEKSSGHWPSSSVWEKSSGDWPSSSMWEKISGHWPSSSEWEHSNGKGASSSKSAHSTGKEAASSGDEWGSSSNWGYSSGQWPSSSNHHGIPIL